MSGSTQTDLALAAVVVAYKPDMNILDGLLLKLVYQVRRIFLVDNGGGEAYLSDSPSERRHITYLCMHSNAGLGAALNAGIEEARRAGCRYVLTFDQDSSPPAGMAEQLYRALVKLQLGGIACAAVGPRFFDRRAEVRRCFPMYRETGGRIVALGGDSLPCAQEVDVLITSGCLVDTDVWAAGVRYDHALMVDYTDTDWCFRARAAGWRLFVDTTVQMPHQLSDSPPVRAFGISLLRYSPLRRYYYFRNTIYFVRQPYVSFAWRRRLLLGLVVRLAGNMFVDDAPFTSLKFSIIGLLHGLSGKMGIYAGMSRPDKGRRGQRL